MFSKRLLAFQGIRPRTAPRRLGEQEAQIAKNAHLYSGELVPLRAGSLVYTSGHSALASIFRLVRGSTEAWLAFPHPTNVAIGPIAKNPDKRFYFTRRPPGATETFLQAEPRVSDYLLATNGGGTTYPNGWYVLGIPKVATAPSVGTTGGSSTITVSRAYVYTFVSRSTFSDGSVLDEEGPPSPPTVASGLQDATWNLTALEAAPPNTGTVSAVEASQPSAGFTRLTLNTVRYLRVGELIYFTGLPAGSLAANTRYRIAGVDTGAGKVWVQATTTTTDSAAGAWNRDAAHNVSGMVKRIYRTDANGVYRYVGEVAVATTTYNDTTADTGLGTSLLSTNWYPPPTDMHSITVLPNGSAVGISGNQLCYSEPYQLHAWPPAYRKTAAYEGVALGSIGTTVVMTTVGPHYVAQGADPSTVVMQESQGESYPCVAARGVVSLPDGVVWPTENGLAVQSLAGAALFTADTFKYDEWQALKPSTIVAAAHDGRYVMRFQREGSTVTEVLLFDRAEAAFAVGADVFADAMFSDRFNKKMYFTDQGKIYSWDTNENVRLTFDWMSKEFELPLPINLGAAKVAADFTVTPEETAALAAAAAAVVAQNDAMLAGNGWKGGELNGRNIARITVNDSPLLDPPALVYDQLWFYLYADGELKFGKQVTTDRPFSMPRGYKADNFAVRVQGNVRVRSIEVGDNHEALKQV